MIGPYSLTQNGEGTTCKQHDMGLLLLQSPDNKLDRDSMHGYPEKTLNKHRAARTCAEKS